jgi:hypothetical protein
LIAVLLFDEIATDYPRRELKDHVAGKKNICINLVRQTKMSDWRHALISDTPAPAVFVEIKDGSSIFPLYLYPTEDTAQQQNMFDPHSSPRQRGDRGGSTASPTSTRNL